MVAIFCGKLYEGGTPTVFGDGRQTRDYIYVEDVVGAMMRAAESDVHRRLQRRPRRGDLGARPGRRPRRARPRARILGGDGSFEPEFAPPRPGEVQRNALDPTKAREVLGFEAKVGVKDGLRVTLNSFR